MHLSVLLLALVPAILARSVQLSGLTLPSSAQGHRDAVEKIFVESYAAYKKFAWGQDDVLPISKGFDNGLNGWGASLVDAMSTMHIMGLDDLFLEAVEFTKTIDYSQSQTDATVSVFETTIRHLGGLLSAYELSEFKFPILVKKATEIADKMAFAWTDDHTIPYGHMNFSTNLPDSPTSNSNIAEAGTLVLEWSRLSKYTNNDTYRALAEGALKTIINGPKPLPGLPAQGISPVTGLPVGGYVTWGGGSDSYFEYLIKFPRLTNTDDNTFADSWHTAVDSSITTLLKTSTVGNHVYLADYDSTQRIRHIGSHLACFHGGNWILGGSLLNNQTIIDIGLQLVDSCWNTYAGTSTGIGPEVFAWISSDGNFTGQTAAPTDEQLKFYEANGYYITAADYIQRPEVLESNFYAYRATGDEKYLDRAASAIDSFNKFLHVPDGFGFVGLEDVNNITAGLIDDTQSFFFAETLKYLYLTFDDPEHISLDEWVFNTECHPFIAPKPKAQYGSGSIPRLTQPFRTTSGDLPEISPNRFLPVPLKKVINPSGK